MSSNYPYSIIFTGDTTAFRSAIQEVKGELSTLQTYTVQWGDVTEKGLGKMPQMAWRALFGFQMLNWMMQMGITAMYRQTMSTEALANAQQNYNETVIKFGASSEQARNALRQLERQQLMVERANQLATLSYISFGMQAISAILAVFPFVDALIAKQITLNALMGPKGWAILAAGVGVAAGAMITYGIAQSQINNNINVNVEANGNTEQALDWAAAEAKRRLRAQGG